MVATYSAFATDRSLNPVCPGSKRMWVGNPFLSTDVLNGTTSTVLARG